MWRNPPHATGSRGGEPKHLQDPGGTALQRPGGGGRSTGKEPREVTLAKLLPRKPRGARLDTGAGLGVNGYLTVNHPSQWAPRNQFPFAVSENKNSVWHRAPVVLHCEGLAGASCLEY